MFQGHYRKIKNLLKLCRSFCLKGALKKQMQHFWEKMLHEKNLQSPDLARTHAKKMKSNGALETVFT